LKPLFRYRTIVSWVHRSDDRRPGTRRRRRAVTTRQDVLGGPLRGLWWLRRLLRPVPPSQRPWRRVRRLSTGSRPSLSPENVSTSSSAWPSTSCAPSVCPGRSSARPSGSPGRPCRSATEISLATPARLCASDSGRTRAAETEEPPLTRLPGLASRRERGSSLGGAAFGAGARLRGATDSRCGLHPRARFSRVAGATPADAFPAGGGAISARTMGRNSARDISRDTPENAASPNRLSGWGMLAIVWIACVNPTYSVGIPRASESRVSLLCTRSWRQSGSQQSPATTPLTAGGVPLWSIARWQVRGGCWRKLPVVSEACGWE
jgi:hypothetical protein